MWKPYNNTTVHSQKYYSHKTHVHTHRHTVPHVRPVEWHKISLLKKWIAKNQYNQKTLYTYMYTTLLILQKNTIIKMFKRPF